MSIATILNSDQIYIEELIRENARLTVQIEAGHQHRRELETVLTRLKQENEDLSIRAEQAERDLSITAAELEQEKAMGPKLDQAIKDLHFVMSGGDVCAVCKNKCLMGEDCRPRWKGLDDCKEIHNELET